MPFPFRKIANRLRQGDAARTTKEKGAALEDVVEWTFCSLPGLSVLKRDFTDKTGGSEIDLLLYNDVRYTPVLFLSEHPLIECKNWNDPVNSATVRDFLGKLRSCRLKVGIRSARRFGPSFLYRSPEPVAVGAGFDDVSAIRDPVQQGFAEPGIWNHLSPF